MNVEVLTSDHDWCGEFDIEPSRKEMATRERTFEDREQYYESMDREKMEQAEKAAAESKARLDALRKRLIPPAAELSETPRTSDSNSESVHSE